MQVTIIRNCKIHREVFCSCLLPSFEPIKYRNFKWTSNHALHNNILAEQRLQYVIKRSTRRDRFRFEDGKK